MTSYEPSIDAEAGDLLLFVADKASVVADALVHSV